MTDKPGETGTLSTREKQIAADYALGVSKTYGSLEAKALWGAGDC